MPKQPIFYVEDTSVKSRLRDLAHNTVVYTKDASLALRVAAFLNTLPDGASI